MRIQMDPNDPRVQDIMKKRARHRERFPRFLVGYQIHKSGERVPVNYETAAENKHLVTKKFLGEMRDRLQLRG